MRRAYREGDYLITCARSGQKALRSDCVKEWDGKIVIREYSETRHPLDRQAPPRPESVPHDARPPGTDTFLREDYNLTIGGGLSYGYNDGTVGAERGSIDPTTYKGKSITRMELSAVTNRLFIGFAQSEAGELAQDFWTTVVIGGSGGGATLNAADADLFDNASSALWRFDGVALDWENHIGEIQAVTFLNTLVTASSLGPAPG